MNARYDVAIIGAGPSGCACALALHGSGLKVALVDQASFPRDKVCGDAIPGPAFKAMDSIHKDWGLAMRQLSAKVDISASSFYAQHKQLLSYTWTLYSYNSKRWDFDSFLLDLVRKHTATDILENKRLQQVRVNLEAASCQFKDGSTLQAAMVIGCDGATSIVRRNLQEPSLAPKQGLVALRAYYHGVEGLQAGVNEIHLSKELAGYFWIFPLQNGWANVGFGILKEQQSKEANAVSLNDTLQNIISTPDLVPRFKNALPMEKTRGFALPIWTGKQAISGNRWMLCGDAASLIDPLQGHGIDTGMWSGIWAAKQAMKCFKDNDFSAKSMQQYDQEVYQKLGPGFNKSYLIMKTLIRFPFILTLISSLGKYQKVTKWAIKRLKL
ncbi:MAG: NAD(P)/FAD-dependent oxidoreductase [Chitinophagales bacterium]|nr:NAD(P)/FAD-dependent oxidoreductase [Chitinophagales bacterium]